MKRLFIILIGILLIFLGIRGPIIGLAGKNASGVITGTKRIVNSSSQKSDYNYSITYSYTDSKGKSYTGSYQMNKVYDVTKLPASGTGVAVRYFQYYPSLSVLKSKVIPGISEIVMAGIGIFLILFGGSRRKKQAS